MSATPLAMPLIQLIRDAGWRAADIQGDPNVIVTGIATHAQSVRSGEAFLAQRGTHTDSHKLIPEALSRGASVLFVETDIKAPSGVTVVRVPSTRLMLGQLAQAFFGNPGKKLTVLGTTGTNGKTSTTHLLFDILRRSGVRAGRIGTLGCAWNDIEVPGQNTTPGPLDLARTMASMVEGGVTHLAMEVSSHAVDQGRVCGVPFTAGALTSISQDHLDYHGDFPTYISCKKRFFLDHVYPSEGTSIFNLDDPVGDEFAGNYLGTMLGFTRGSDRPADIRALDAVSAPNFTEFILEIQGKRTRVRSPLVGWFNLTNMLAAAGLAYAAGIDLGTIGEGLSEANAIPGRFEQISAGQDFTVIVDYAHTPDALERVIRTARRLCRGRMITLFGCGGDRDRGKRPLMGRIAGELSDLTLLTSDNPRNEDPESIARHALEGIIQSGRKPGEYHLILDRRMAIERALNLAAPGDVVLLAGKGHEPYQETRGRRIEFDDRRIAREILTALSAHRTQASPEMATTATSESEA